MSYYHIDNQRNGQNKWVVRDPQDVRVALTDTRAEGQALADALNERNRLRVLLAWTAGTLAESQACALLKGKPEDLARWRDTCLAGGQR